MAALSRALIAIAAVAAGLLTAVLASAEPSQRNQPRVINDTVIRKLCPNPNARCLARDNPDFYRETDPTFYYRITKPAPVNRN